MQHFWRFQPPENETFCSTDNFEVPIKSVKDKNFEKKLFTVTVQKFSELLRKPFWTSSDHVVSEKYSFCKNLEESGKSNKSPLPPGLATAVICDLFRE